MRLLLGHRHLEIFRDKKESKLQWFFNFSVTKKLFFSYQDFFHLVSWVSPYSLCVSVSVWICEHLYVCGFVSMCVHLCAWMSDCVPVYGSLLRKLGDPHRTPFLCASCQLSETGIGENHGLGLGGVAIQSRLGSWC